MKFHPILRTILHATLCLALAGAAGVALAQNAPPAGSHPDMSSMATSPQQPPANRKIPKAVYHTDQGTLIIKSTVPKQRDYGPAPDFATLDTNHDGRLSETGDGRLRPAR